MPVNKSSLSFQNPVIPTNEKYLSFKCVITKLIGAVTGKGDFSDTYHVLVIRHERRDRQEIWDDDNDAKLKELVTYLNSIDLRLILCAKNTVSCMKVWDTTVTGTVLVAMESHDFYVHVMMSPPP